MGFIKNIARKILQKEIGEYQFRLDNARNDIRQEFSKKFSDEKLKHSEELLKEVQKTANIKKENEILRQYYDLDKEPSDEIKTKFILTWRLTG